MEEKTNNIICTNCGAEIKEGNNFCTNCGAEIKEENNINMSYKKKDKFNKKHILLIVVTILICFLLFTILMKYNKNSIEQNENSTVSHSNDEIEELKIDNLKYDIELKENGNMEIIETWNVEISNTNTLYKTFTLDDSKYKGISNVKVSEILENGQEKELEKIDKEMYYVTKNCYYALINSNNQFEIAWGIDTTNEIKTYKITYTVENVIKVYNDCAELYWQLIGTEFSIPVDNIEGNISLEKQCDIDNVKMWGHTKDKEGKIKYDGTNILFSTENFKVGNYLEIRLALPKESFDTNNSYNIDMLNTIIEEENS